jgi:cobalamin biosynthesis Mg chelatase CobN
MGAAVTRAGARRRRALALLGASALAFLPLLVPSSAAGSQPIDCVLNPDAPECASTSSAVEEETSTSADEPSTTEEEVVTTEGETATSVDAPITTAEADDIADATSTTLGVTTSSNLLVPGDGTEGAQSTTTTTTRPASTVEDGGTSDATLIALVIAGLVAVALLVAFLTWRYWVATRPPILPGA